MSGRRLPRPAFLIASPLLRRLAWHARRIARGVDRKFFVALAEGAGAIVLVAALLVTLLEKPWTEGLGKAVPAFGQSVNWAIFTVLGQGDAGYVTSIGGYVVSWLLVVFGVAIVGTITGALVALVIDFLLKEGQGLGASGYHDHIVVCGWNATARDLMDELRGDDYKRKVVVLQQADKNPAGQGVYFVSGDPAEPGDLTRAGIEEAAAAVIFPADDSNESDMASILTIMAIKAIAGRITAAATL